MNIGMMGMGKLGLPVALAIEDKGHNVVGYDINSEIKHYIKDKQIPYKEEGAEDLLQKTNIEMVSIPELVKKSDLIFVAIQTPHHPRYEGITPVPFSKVDFDYEYLKQGVKELSDTIKEQSESKIISIISTVLPGTIDREIKPLLCDKVKLVYNPFFIAMGTTIYDFLNPEFVLLGKDDPGAEKMIKEFYSTIHDKHVVSMSIPSAELTKVSYNTYITMKITLACNIMEICHKIPEANVDDVTEALKMATDRIVSPKYMDGGMQDGGGCHPRDNIALSWLAEELDLSSDIYEDMMLTRESQTEWLAWLIVKEKEKNIELPIIILGKSFKPETNLTVGSPAILLKNLLQHLVDNIFKQHEVKIIHLDPIVDETFVGLNVPAIHFIATKHEVFKTYQFPKGSIVLDPFRYIEDQEGVKVIRIGE